MSIYLTLGKTLLIAGIMLAIITMFDYAVFLAHNSGRVSINPYEYIQFLVIAILVLAGILLMKKYKSR
ncbi:MAG: hypothetical protein ACREBA_02725 [Nitrosotalea sp.]